MYDEAPDYLIDYAAPKSGTSKLVHRRAYNGGTLCRDEWKREPRTTYRDDEVTCRVCLSRLPR